MHQEFLTRRDSTLLELESFEKSQRHKQPPQNRRINMHMTFQTVPPGYLFSSTFTGKKCSYLKLREPYFLKNSKSLREEGKRVNAVRLGAGEPVCIAPDEEVEDIAEPTREGAAVMLRGTFFVFVRNGNDFVGAVDAVTTSPQDSGVLITVS